jgi:hypothetical protein
MTEIIKWTRLDDGKLGAGLLSERGERAAWGLCQLEPAPVTLPWQRNSGASVRPTG